MEELSLATAITKRKIGGKKKSYRRVPEIKEINIFVIYLIQEESYKKLEPSILYVTLILLYNVAN